MILIDLIGAAKDRSMNLVLQDEDYVAVVHNWKSFQRAFWHDAVIVRMTAGGDLNMLPGGSGL